MDVKKAQKLAGEVEKKISRQKWDAFQRVADLLEEAGEAASEVKALEGLKLRPGDKKKLAEELADVIYSTLALANYYGIDVADVFEKKVTAYEKKYNKTA